MKEVSIILLLSLLMTATLVWGQTPPSRKAEKGAVVTFDVSLHCESCKANLEKHIPFEKGFKDMQVDVEKKTVTITYDPTKTSVATLKAAIEKLGYTCSVRKPAPEK